MTPLGTEEKQVVSLTTDARATPPAKKERPFTTMNRKPPTIGLMRKINRR